MYRSSSPSFFSHCLLAMMLTGPLLLLGPGCTIETRSPDYRCTVPADCDLTRLCVDGFCLSSELVGCTTFDGSICTFDCTADGDCPQAIACPADYACQVDCGVDACAGGVDCSLAESCDINCDGNGSCATALACGAGACDISCAGNDSCAGGIDCTSACVCDTDCSGARACAVEPTCPGGMACVANGDCKGSNGNCSTC